MATEERTVIGLRAIRCPDAPADGWYAVVAQDLGEALTGFRAIAVEHDDDGVYLPDGLPTQEREDGDGYATSTIAGLFHEDYFPEELNAGWGADYGNPFVVGPPEIGSEREAD
jgi:hypothetical protein